MQQVDKLKKIISAKLSELEKLHELDSMLLEKLSGDSDEILDDYAENKDKILDSLDELENETAAAIRDIRACLDSGEKISGTDRKDLLDSIGRINDLTASAIEEEKKAREKVTSYIMARRNEVKKGRATSRAALNYYQVQNNTAYIDPQFMDRKK